MPFNRIWNADMSGNGILPLIKGVSDSEREEDKGYVIVDMNPFPDGEASRDLPGEEQERQVNVLTEVTIPTTKMASYELFKKFHDNYDWRARHNDPVTAEEEEEILKLLQFSINTKPMEIVREYAMEKGVIGTNSSDEDWLELIRDIWFGQYRRNSTSAFEHIFMGEQKGRSELSGHHSWYHYHINDGPFEVTHNEDAIQFLKHVEVVGVERSHLAEVITIKYKYEQVDSAGNKKILHKEKGGFFVGISTEGLLALGTAAFLDGREHIHIEINGESYDLNVYREDSKLRTFFPVIEQAVPAGH
ncbi:Endoribonuclease XendoU [compost metagenome]